MKKIYLIISIAVFGMATAQNLGQYSNIESAFKSRLLSYDCEYKAVDDSLFNSQFSKIFNTVILSNSDIISNGTAFSFSQNKDDNVLSLNTSFKLLPTRNYYFDIGLNVTDKSGGFNFYSNQSLAKDIGLKLNLVIPLGGSQFFMKDDCDRVNLIRQKEINKKLVSYRQLMQKEILKMKHRKAELESKIDQQVNYTSKDNSDYFKELDQLDQDIEKLTKLLLLDNEGIEQLVTKDISKIDNDNDIFVGYSAHWANISGNFMNKKIEFPNESILDITKQQKIDRFYKYTLEISYNYTHSNKSMLWFAQAAGRYIKGNFLDNPFINNPKLTVGTIPDNSTDPPGVASYTVLNGSEYIGEYSFLNDSQYRAELNGYGALFFLFKKSFGFSLRATFNFPSGSVLYAYPQNYSGFGGIVFRNLSEKNFGKATISLLAGVENLPYNVNPWDRLLIKASIGVPFTIFSKEEKPKEEKAKDDKSK